ncbi:Ankyrin repeat and zinc finger domain-containing protein 1, partial [Basidiobolus ranarum]
MTDNLNFKELSIFSIPEPLLKSLQPCKVLEKFRQLSETSEQNNIENSRQLDVTFELSNLHVGTSLTCAICGGIRFDSVEDQREHVRLDWHRYNLKRRTIQGLSGFITEDEFEYMIADLSSISGSSSDEYIMEGIQELHDQIFFYLIVVLVL